MVATRVKRDTKTRYSRKISLSNDRKEERKRNAQQNTPRKPRKGRRIQRSRKAVAEEDVGYFNPHRPWCECRTEARFARARESATSRSKYICITVLLPILNQILFLQVTSFWKRYRRKTSKIKFARARKYTHTTTFNDSHSRARASPFHERCLHFFIVIVFFSIGGPRCERPTSPRKHGEKAILDCSGNPNPKRETKRNRKQRNSNR